MSDTARYLLWMVRQLPPGNPRMKDPQLIWFTRLRVSELAADIIAGRYT